jgi:hypothetical protein
MSSTGKIPNPFGSETLLQNSQRFGASRGSGPRSFASMIGFWILP